MAIIQDFVTFLNTDVTMNLSSYVSDRISPNITGTTFPAIVYQTRGNTHGRGDL
jgi:hypothetical protein